MTRSIQQFRPKGDPSALPYAPQRDLANIFTPMLREVFAGLDEKNWTPFFCALFARDGITEQQLSDAVVAFVEAHRLFIRDRAVDSPEDAFVKAGVDRLPDAVKYALFSRLGEVLTGGFFVALRDITMQGQPTPGHTDFAEMIAAGRELSNRISGQMATYEVGELECLRADRDELQRVVVQLQGMLDEALATLRATPLHASLPATSTEKDSLRENVQQIQRENWFSRIFATLRLAWLIYRKQPL